MEEQRTLLESQVEVDFPDRKKFLFISLCVLSFLRTLPFGPCITVHTREPAYLSSARVEQRMCDIIIFLLNLVLD